MSRQLWEANKFIITNIFLTCRNRFNCDSTVNTPMVGVTDGVTGATSVYSVNLMKKPLHQLFDFFVEHPTRHP